MRAIGWAWLGTVVLFGCGSSEGGGGGSGGGSGTHALNIHLSGSGAGHVRSSAPAFDCNAQCTQNVAPGSNVILSAIPAEGSTFAGWQSVCSGTGTCTVTMDGDHDVTASFSALPPGSALVKVELPGKGTGRVVSSPPGIDCPGACSMTVPLRSTVSFTAQADAGSSFLGWGGPCSGGGDCSFGAAGDQTVWADFELKSPPASCAGNSPPDSPAMQSYATEKIPYSFTCDPGIGDAGGTLAFVRHYHDPNNHSDGIDFVRADGTVLGHVSTNQGLSLLPQPAGASAVAGGPYLGPLANRGAQLVNFDSAGKATGGAFVFGHAPIPSAPDPAGGVLLAGDLALSVVDPATGTPTPAGPTAHSAVMFTGGGTAPAVRWGPKALASSGTVFGLGVDSVGRSLIITDGAPAFGAGNISAQWFDRDGAALTGEFVLLSAFVPGPSTWFETSPLIGSGLLVRRMDAGLHAQALVTVGSGTTFVQDAPAWMRTRTDTRLQIVRGGHAYAVLPYGAKGVACSQRLEVVASDGTSCGSTDFPIAQGACDTKDLTVGADGTVMQQLPDSMESRDPFNDFHTCTWRWWTGSLSQGAARHDTAGANGEARGFTPRLAARR